MAPSNTGSELKEIDELMDLEDLANIDQVCPPTVYVHANLAIYASLLPCPYTYCQGKPLAQGGSG